MPGEPKPKGPPPCQPVQCATCIFREDGGQLHLTPGRMVEIELYLLGGRTHLCHSRPSRGPRKLACRGGRDFQLRAWTAMRILPEPTDAALAAEMERMGL